MQPARKVDICFRGAMSGLGRRRGGRGEEWEILVGSFWIARGV